ncbi:MAG TPA: thiamine pyrophosphate-binding protein [Streptosporangiaceae bacterium]
MTTTAPLTAPGPAAGPVTAAGTVLAVLGNLGVERAIGVPDSQLSDVLAAIGGRMPVDFTVREDIAVAIAFGLELAGHRGAVFMKNAGLGTSLDSLISLAIAAQVPVLLVIGWAGSGRDTLGHHVVMGERSTALLDAAGISYDIVCRRGQPGDAARFSARAAAAIQRRCPYALLVQP